MRQHGFFTIEWQGPVLVVRYLDTWNLVAVEALHREARQAWAARTTTHWAMLSDLRAWDGATPDSLERWWGFFDDAVAHGLTTVTDIFSTQFHGLLVESVAQRAGALVHYHRSGHPAAAWEWLAAQGFAAPGPG